MDRPTGAYFCVYRGELRLRDDEDFVLDGYDPKELRAETVNAQKEVSPEVLAEVLHWIVQDCTVSAMAPTLASYLSNTFDIKLKSQKKDS